MENRLHLCYVISNGIYFHRIILDIKHKYRQNEKVVETIWALGVGCSFGSRRRIPVLALCGVCQRHLSHNGIALDQYGMGSRDRRIVYEFI